MNIPEIQNQLRTRVASKFKIKHQSSFNPKGRDAIKQINKRLGSGGSNTIELAKL